jgi:hypothetical protein
MSAARLPGAACTLGYTSTQLLGILGPERFGLLTEWMQARHYALGTAARSGDRLG